MCHHYENYENNDVKTDWSPNVSIGNKTISFVKLVILIRLMLYVKNLVQLIVGFYPPCYFYIIKIHNSIYIYISIVSYLLAK